MYQLPSPGALDRYFPSSSCFLEGGSSSLDVQKTPKFQKHKEQSPLLIEDLLTVLTFDRSTSVMVGVGFLTGVIESLRVGWILHGRGGAVLGVYAGLP